MYKLLKSLGSVIAGLAIAIALVIGVYWIQAMVAEHVLPLPASPAELVASKVALAQAPPPGLLPTTAPPTAHDFVDHLIQAAKDRYQLPDPPQECIDAMRAFVEQHGFNQGDVRYDGLYAILGDAGWQTFCLNDDAGK